MLGYVVSDGCPNKDGPAAPAVDAVTGPPKKAYG